MSRKTEIILAVVVLLILGILLWWFLGRPETTIDTTPADNQGSVSTSDDKPNVQPVATENIPSNAQVSASTVARVFVERFGSYSSESDYQNVEDVKALATESFARELEAIAATARKNAAPGYYGISTKIFSLQVTSQTETAATVEASVQRLESVGIPGNTEVFSQKITVELVKVGEAWLIDGFTWGDKI